MDVILLDKVGKLGEVGDKVTVRAGFGRNFLIPQGRALPANKANLAEFEARRAELEEAAHEKKALAEKRAAELAELTVTIVANAGDEGKLFGSVGAGDIAEAVTAVGTGLAKAEVKLPEGAIRETGSFEITVQLHSEVSQLITVVVAAE